MKATTDGNERRAFLAWASAGVLLAACRRDHPTATETTSAEAKTSSAADAGKNEKKDEKEKEDDVGAVEDLMREHGVIRRVLVVYRDAAARLRTKPLSVPPDALQKAAKLIRSFGEDYHEKQLEEAHIFPALRAAGGPAAAAVDTLAAQHQRGREITDYILAMTGKPLGAPNAEAVAKVLEGFARMYEEHAAIEDTVVFPAWKKTLTRKQLAEMGDRFEDIEHKTFGRDGFDDAVEQMTAIEKALGIELAVLTPPSPPKP